jgi:hypothetical protein
MSLLGKSPAVHLPGGVLVFDAVCPGWGVDGGEAEVGPPLQRRVQHLGGLFYVVVPFVYVCVLCHVSVVLQGSVIRRYKTIIRNGAT